MKDIKTYLKGMVAKGHTEAKFGHLEHAHLFKGLLADKGIPSKIEEKLGHATTIDMTPGTVLSKHWHVMGLHNTSHKILGKFV